MAPTPRMLPLGALPRLPLGQDDSEIVDVTDSGAGFDMSQPLTSPTFAPSPVSNEGLISAPNPQETYTFAPTVGPAAPGQITPIQNVVGGGASTTDLNQMILTGQMAPPAGSNLTQAQVQQLASSGADAQDIGAILTGQATPATIMQELANATKLAAQTTQMALSIPSGTGKAPTPTTVPIAYTYNAQGQLVPITAAPQSSFTQALASAESWFSQPSIVGGMSNGVLSLAAIAGLAIVGGIAQARR